MKLISVLIVLSGVILAGAVAVAAWSGTITEPRTLISVGLGLVPLLILLYVRRKGGFES